MGPEGLRANQSRSSRLCDTWIIQWKTPQFAGKNLLIVEGPSDESFFKKFVSSSTEIRNAGGCSSLHDVYLEINQKSNIVSFAIKDSDFARINGSMLVTPGFFYTDCHDHEIMCLSNPEVLIATLSDLSITCTEKDINNFYVELSALSLLKWFSYSSPDKRLVTRHINPGGLTIESLQDMTFLLTKAISDTRNNGREVDVTIEEVEEFCHAHERYDVYEIVNGHDVISMFIRHACKLGVQCSKRDFLDSLHSKYCLEHFVVTNLYRESTLWANEHSIEIWAPVSND